MRWRFFGMMLVALVEVVFRRELVEVGCSAAGRERRVREVVGFLSLFTLLSTVFLLLLFDLSLALLEPVPRKDRSGFATVFRLELFLSLLSTLSACSSWLSSSLSLSLSNCEREARDVFLFDDVSKSTLRSTDCVRERVRYAIKSLLLPSDFFEVLAAARLLECAVELVAKDDEYDDEVELEKLRRRRLVFLLLADVDGISSSVSSSVVLLGFKRMLKNRFRRSLSVVVVAVFDDEDVSDLRFFRFAKIRERWEPPLANLFLCNWDVCPKRRYLHFNDDDVTV